MCNRSYPDNGIGLEVTFVRVQGLWADGVISRITDLIHRRLLLVAECKDDQIKTGSGECIYSARPIFSQSRDARLRGKPTHIFRNLLSPNVKHCHPERAFELRFVIY